MYFSEAAHVWKSDQHFTQCCGSSRGTWWLNIATMPTERLQVVYGQGETGRTEKVFAFLLAYVYHGSANQWIYCCLFICLHYSTNRQVAGSIPYGVIGIFQWHNPSGRTMIQGSTQPLTEMSTRCISWGKGGRCVRLTTILCHCHEIWEP